MGELAATVTVNVQIKLFFRHRFSDGEKVSNMRQNSGSCETLATRNDMVRLLQHVSASSANLQHDEYKR